MTQHHDPVHPDEGDLDPFEALSAADDAYVAGLLADLPDVTMPADVASRIDAVLSADAGRRRAPSRRRRSGATDRPRSPPRRSLGATHESSRWRPLQCSCSGPASSASGLSGSTLRARPPTPAAGRCRNRLTRRGPSCASTRHAYTTQTLDADVRALVAGQFAPTADSVGGAPVPTSTATPLAPAPAPTTSPGASGGVLEAAAAAEPSDAHLQQHQPGPLHRRGRGRHRLRRAVRDRHRHLQRQAGPGGGPARPRLPRLVRRLDPRAQLRAKRRRRP